MLRSHVIEKGVNLRDCFDCIEAVEFEGAAVEAFGKIAIAREIFLLDLEISWPAVSVIHVVGLIGRRTDIESVVWIGRVSLRHMELSLLLIARVLRVRLNALFLKILTNNLALNQLFSSLEIPKRTHNLRIRRHDILLKIHPLRPNIILHPRGPILLIGGIVQTTPGRLGEGTLCGVIHAILFIT